MQEKEIIIYIYTVCQSGNNSSIVRKENKMSKAIKEKVSVEKIEHYDPYNDRARANGMITEWVGRNTWGNSVAFGYTKAECMADARNKGYGIEK